MFFFLKKKPEGNDILKKSNQAISYKVYRKKFDKETKYYTVSERKEERTK
jgi:hypothetical protein